MKIDQYRKRKFKLFYLFPFLLLFHLSSISKPNQHTNKEMFFWKNNPLEDSLHSSPKIIFSLLNLWAGEMRISYEEMSKKNQSFVIGGSLIIIPWIIYPARSYIYMADYENITFGGKIFYGQKLYSLNHKTFFFPHIFYKYTYDFNNYGDPDIAVYIPHFFSMLVNFNGSSSFLYDQEKHVFAVQLFYGHEFQNKNGSLQEIFYGVGIRYRRFSYHTDRDIGAYPDMYTRPLTFSVHFGINLGKYLE